MLHSSGIDSTAAGPVPVRSWRVTTAVRVFALALVTGTLLSKGQLEEAAPLLGAMVIIAGACSALEWGSLDRRVPLIPVSETALVGLILTSAPPHGSLIAYVAVPTIVAGVQHGFVTTLNAALIGAVTCIAVLSASSDPDRASRLAAVAPWLLTGLGAGLLASWQSRSARDLGSRIAPYVAAHHLMAQLHGLARQGAIGLDSSMLASELGASLRAATGADRCAVFVQRSSGTMTLVSSYGDARGLLDHIGASPDDRVPGIVVIPLTRAGGRTGVVVLAGVASWSEDLVAETTAIAAEFALRLDTAVLFDDVRFMAASEERNRIAREMHDGVAQEIVALGYVVDEIESVSPDAETRALAVSLRKEISRVVTELRHSIFDLRHQVGDLELSGALAEYAQAVSSDTDLRVHLVLDSTGPQLPARTQSEVLRVAQEAIGNVRRHARAANLWVSYVSDGSSLRLEVADDGIGNAVPRERHWGLQTMQERADGIGAQLAVTPRPGGGTVVCLLSRPHAASEGTSRREHHNPAR
ncbi:sensor histidine kinase [Nocardioides pinisoli]|uniref:Histidine kinase n=1 Tax=Nocardioides pinisoli TaxID=2950279 RepID=A0ABT1KTU8_9ACTN|nr:histidine kinase [Nocardioides pinisoli]MCP3421159.1 histidine kinase [Nocardioides pinisoli]